MVKNRNETEKYVLIFAVILSIVAWIISFRLGFVLTYNDAASHLNIARRVVDNLTPGIAQLGTVWLPLPHLLMLPFASNTFLWHTGIAGSIVSVVSYVISVVFIYKLIYLITRYRFGAILGLLVIALNPNFLYLATTPMTEPLFLTALIVSVYYLAKYIKMDNILDLVLGGLFVMAATLTRYDGWFLFVCLLILLSVWSYFTLGRKRAEGILFLFASIGGFGILLWFIWNLSIFGDALYFITGPYSAYAQQKILRNVGQLPTEGNISTSLSYFIWSVIDNNGIILAFTGLIGVFTMPFVLKSKKQIFSLLAFLSLFIFNILALYLGQSAMNVPQAVNNPGYFNIRYGLIVLPAVALAVGILASMRSLRWIILATIVFQNLLFVVQGKPVVLIDSIRGLKNTYYTVEASRWLANNYQKGLILTSLASHDAFVARAGLPMKLYIHEGTREHWRQALKNPSKEAFYIALLSYPPDIVYKALKENPDFKNNYQLVHAYGTFEIYQLQGK